MKWMEEKLKISIECIETIARVLVNVSFYMH